MATAKLEMKVIPDYTKMADMLDIVSKHMTALALELRQRGEVEDVTFEEEDNVKPGPWEHKS
jgi:hypothetical protein